MSWNPALEPGCPDEIGVDSIETLIIPRARDLGDFEVRRAILVRTIAILGCAHYLF